MRAFLATLILTGCSGTNVVVERDDTGMLRRAVLERSMLSGPVDVRIEVKPDGTVILHWKSDVEVVDSSGAIAEGIARGLSTR
jgi:hypothetical protein